MVVDEQGWGEVATLLGETLDRVLEIQAESSERLADSDEAGHALKVEMMHFKSPAPEAETEARGVRCRVTPGRGGAAQGLSGAAASGVATTKEKLSSR